MSRAFLLKDGKPRSMPSAEAEGIASDHDFLWLHLDGRDESAIATIQSDEGIPAIARSALLAHETRPRCAVLNGGALINLRGLGRSEEHTSELQSLMRNSYAVFCLKKKTNTIQKKIAKISTQ